MTSIVQYSPHPDIVEQFRAIPFAYSLHEYRGVVLTTMILIGAGAEELDRNMKEFISQMNPSEEEMDDFLSPYIQLGANPVRMH